MLSVHDAQERALERISPLDPLELTVSEAHGCVLSETVTAPEDLPAFASSAVDGFAVRSEDTATASSSPVSFTIIGDSTADKPFTGRIGHGEAVRVAAGAAIPEEGDAVIAESDAAVVGSSMALGRSFSRGENVSPAGQDLARGDSVLEQGQRIRGMDVGVLAALGRSRVLVQPRPRVVVFSTGDELRDPGQPLGTGLVRDSNSFVVAGMTREAGAEPTRAGIVPDDPAVLREKFQSFMPQADVFVTSGGISGDPTDRVREVVEAIGEIVFRDVAVEPGSSFVFGSIEGRPYFGLPGNPVAAVVTFELFVRPALLKMAGRKTIHRPEVSATFDDSYRKTEPKEAFLRVRAWQDETGWRARLSGRQGPSIVSSVSSANALAVVPTERLEVKPGDPVTLKLLEPLEGW